ncbi:NAD(P)-binding protein [Myriangium duriaei CBS 260.36]|uniref:NAD(P)-binding protein n=1 Tax=Myriangium duriaei CBS 260.36 TaxID=1168546 RepID=A0A9P4IYH4_9PEZI|nr:NAD(P)-binding protein [Myriangium duriaei CBS 260.36]
MASVIVFGASGKIGSVVAMTAAKLGAHVVLATRNMKKSIPGLNEEEQQDGGFARVEADLLKPDTVSSAIRSTMAKRAFVYRAFGSQDDMRSTLVAMKEAGVDFVVFLSSFTVPTDKFLRDVSPEDRIPYAHAQVEANLEDVCGAGNHIAVRPGAFASNLFRWQGAIKAGKEVRLFGSTFEQDNITQDDIGRVSGTILVSGPKLGQRKVYLYGPQILSLREAVIKIAEILNQEVKVVDLNDEEGLSQYIDSGMSEETARYMVRVFGSKQPGGEPRSKFVNYQEGVDNVQLYTGEPSTSFENWVVKCLDLAKFIAHACLILGINTGHFTLPIEAALVRVLLSSW